MYHCDIIDEIILMYLLHWLYFFREAIESFVLWFYIWSILLFGALFYLTEWMEIAAVKSSLVPFPHFLSLFLNYSNYFLIKVFRGFQKNLVESFYTGVHDNLCPSVNTSLSVEVNSMIWCQEALTEHVSMYPVSVCSSSFLPCQLRNWAKLH